MERGAPEVADTRAVGWVFKVDIGDRTRIRTQLRKQNNVRVEEDFTDSNKGAAECRDWITKRLARDDWRLESAAFLGYRIIIPADH